MAEIGKPACTGEAAVRVISQHLQAYREIGAPPGAWLVLEFLVRHGCALSGSPLPTGFARMLPRKCFGNAAHVASDRRHRGRLTYMEGYIIHQDFPVPILHAWAYDSDANAVIDPTLVQPEQYGYLGIEISGEERERWKMQGSLGVLISGSDMINLEFLLHRDPGLALLLPASTSEHVRGWTI